MKTQKDIKLKLLSPCGFSTKVYWIRQGLVIWNKKIKFQLISDATKSNILLLVGFVEFIFPAFNLPISKI